MLCTPSRRCIRASWRCRSVPSTTRLRPNPPTDASLNHLPDFAGSRTPLTPPFVLSAAKAPASEPAPPPSRCRFLRDKSRVACRRQALDRRTGPPARQVCGRQHWSVVHRRERVLSRFLHSGRVIMAVEVGFGRRHHPARQRMPRMRLTLRSVSIGRGRAPDLRRRDLGPRSRPVRRQAGQAEGPRRGAHRCSGHADRSRQAPCAGGARGATRDTGAIPSCARPAFNDFDRGSIGHRSTTTPTGFTASTLCSWTAPPIKATRAADSSFVVGSDCRRSRCLPVLRCLDRVR